MTRSITSSESSKVQLRMSFTPNHRSLGTYILILRNIACTRIGVRVKTLPIYDILKLLFELLLYNKMSEGFLLGTYKKKSCTPISVFDIKLL